MQSSDIPSRFPIPFADAAGGAYIRPIPTASQIGIEDGAASLTDGFPPLNFDPVASGGVPPFGEDLNGILYRLSAHARWQMAGGPVPYNATLQTAWGGYPKGALVASSTTFGLWWFSLTENNATNPDLGGAGWLPVTMGIAPAGRVEMVTGSTAPPLTVKANGALISRTTYPALWAWAQASGNLAASDGAWLKGQYSPGDGSTTFRVPDLRGYHLRAWDDGAGVDSGRAIGSIQQPQNMAHTHDVATGSTDSGVGRLASSGNTDESPTATASQGGSETRVLNIATMAVITTGLQA